MVSVHVHYFLTPFLLPKLFTHCKLSLSYAAIDDTQRMMQMGGFGFDASKVYLSPSRLSWIIVIIEHCFILALVQVLIIAFAKLATELGRGEGWSRHYSTWMGFTRIRAPRRVRFKKTRAVETTLVPWFCMIWFKSVVLLQALLCFSWSGYVWCLRSDAYYRLKLLRVC